MKKKKRSSKRRSQKTQSTAKKIFSSIAKTAIITALIVLSIHAFVDLFEKDLFDLLVKHVERNSQGLYLIKYDAVDLDFFKRSIHLKNLSIHPDQEILNRLNSTPSHKKILFDLLLPELEIEGISIIDLVFRKSLNIDKFLLSRGKIKLTRMKYTQEKNQGSSPGRKTSRGTIDKKSNPGPTIRIRQVKVVNTSFQLVDWGWQPQPGKVNSILDIPDLSLNLSALEVYPKGDRQPQPKKASGPGTDFKTYFSFASGNAMVKELEYNTPNGFYTLKAKRIEVSQSAASLSLDSFELVPRYGKYQFAGEKGYQTDRFQIDVPRITFQHLDFNDLFKKQRFHCREAIIKDPRVEIFRDKNIPRRHTLSPKKFPQQLLRESKLILKLENIKISNGGLSYEEHAPGEKKAGKIFVEKIQAHLTNVTNYPELLKNNLAIEAQASTKLMGKSIFKINLRIPILYPENPFTVAGVLEKTDMKAFNSMLEPNAHLRIHRGTIDKLEFSATYGKRTANGKMKFYYRDLKISLLKSKEGGDYRKRAFTSFLANLIIHRHNPSPGEPLRESRIFFEIESPITFFSYIRKSLLSGIKSTVR